MLRSSEQWRQGWPAVARAFSQRGSKLTSDPTLGRVLQTDPVSSRATSTPASTSPTALLTPAGSGAPSLVALSARGGAQPGQPMPGECSAPGVELLLAEALTRQRFLQREQPPSNRDHDFRLAPDHPPPGIGRRQVA